MYFGNIEKDIQTLKEPIEQPHCLQTLPNTSKKKLSRTTSVSILIRFRQHQHFQQQHATFILFSSYPRSWIPGQLLPGAAAAAHSGRHPRMGTWCFHTLYLILTRSCTDENGLLGHEEDRHRDDVSYQRD